MQPDWRTSTSRNPHKQPGKCIRLIFKRPEGVFQQSPDSDHRFTACRSLDLQQFAGVLAHEFGHFAQSSGMRLSYLIRSINHWFARVVFEEDQWTAN